MISRQLDQTAVYTCGGCITDAFTGEPVSGVSIRTYKNALNRTELVAHANTNEYGQYTVLLPCGNYKVVATKENYVIGTEYISVTDSVDDINMVLNPENQPTLSGNLRVVLTWGAKPSDLDSVWKSVSLVFSC